MNLTLATALSVAASSGTLAVLWLREAAAQYAQRIHSTSGSPAMGLELTSAQLDDLAQPEVEREAAVAYVHRKAHDTADEEHLLAALGLTNTATTGDDRAR